jgi:hypothetical protein
MSSPHSSAGGGAPQSAGQLSLVSPPLHLPSPHQGFAANTSGATKMKAKSKIAHSVEPNEDFDGFEFMSSADQRTVPRCSAKEYSSLAGG